ncbi:hypothetical protein ACIQH6_25000 [Micromonospora orduensis]|uniref:hypothetical protein n=1 Tax=Micromonospora orduensis TaxID=1420891 RepID=UPI00382B6112
MDLPGSLTLAEELFQRAYSPQRVTRHFGQGMDVSGPGYHIVSVAVSDDFWDESAERWEEVWAPLRYQARKARGSAHGHVGLAPSSVLP